VIQPGFHASVIVGTDARERQARCAVGIDLASGHA
jgi:hypothetical protein